MIDAIIENRVIAGLVQGFERSRRQVNGLHESDAELVRLPGSNTVLALTTDSIAEEINTGLYTDPYLIGWMMVTVNASDLAAVGSEPVGILLNESLPENLNPDFLSTMQRGVRDACMKSQLPVLGGDTNTSPSLHVGGTAVGLIPDGRPMTRKGCRPGDVVFATGTLGSGNGYALSQLDSLDCTMAYQPLARLPEGQLIRPIASCCMDTSDGVLASLDQLMRINEVGFDIDLRYGGALHPEARQLAQSTGLPSWLFLAGLHGEFELLFTVPSVNVDGLLHATSRQGWVPIRLGEVIETPHIRLAHKAGFFILDTGAMRNVFARFDGNLSHCIQQLLNLVEPCKT